MAVDIIARLKLSGEQFSRQFNSQFDAIENKAKSSSSRIATAWGKVGSAFNATSALAGGVVVAALVSAAKAGLDHASALGEQAEQLGISTDFMQRYRYAAAQSGASVEKADNAISKFTLNLGKAREGSKAQADAFASIGVAINDANGNAIESEAVFTAVAGALSKIEDPARRAAAANGILGKGYKDLMPLLNSGAEGYAALGKEAEKYNMVLSAKEIQNADATADKIDKLTTAFNVSIAKVVGGNSSALDGFIDDLTLIVQRAPGATKAVTDFYSSLPSAVRTGAKTAFLAAYPGGLLMDAGWQAATKRDAPAKQTNSAGPVKPVPASAFLKNAVPSRYQVSNFTGMVRPTSVAEDFAAFMGTGSNDNAAVPAKAAKLSKEAAKAAQEASEAYARLNDQVDRQLTDAREAARIDAMRAQGLDAEADLEEIISDLRRQHSEILAGEPAVAAKALGITEDQVKALRDKLVVLEKITTEQADAKAEAEAIDAEKRAAKAAFEAKKDYDSERQRAQEEQISDLADFYERAFQSSGRSIWSDVKAQGMRTLAQLAAQFTLSLLSGGGGGVSGAFSAALSGLSGAGGGAAGGAAGGDAVSSLMSMFGGGGGSAGAANMAAAGPFGAALAINQLMGQFLGNDQVKNGGLLNLTIGPILTALLGSAKRGSATLGFTNGELGVGSSRGNSNSRIEAAKSGVSALADTLTNIAETLGGSITGAGSVSIGVRKKTYVVDPTGQGRTKGAGVLKFKDEEEAIRAAISDALKDGVIAGISDASQRLLKSGQDIEKALAKASLIESIPKLLKARINPVGAALDELNAKWDKTIAALKEGAASAAQLADAERLYKLERADAMAAANDNLKAFIDALNFGSSSTYGLIDQEKSARAAVEPYLALIKARDFSAVDQEKYLSAADTLLQINREIEGSGVGHFKLIDELKSATQALADGVAKQTGDTAAARDPFAEMTATAAGATASNTLATAEILAQQSTILAKIESQLGSMAAGVFGSAFVGTSRAFLASEAA